MIWSLKLFVGYILVL